MKKVLNAVLMFSLIGSLIGCSGGGAAEPPANGGTRTETPPAAASDSRIRSSSALRGGAVSPGMIIP